MAGAGDQLMKIGGNAVGLLAALDAARAPGGLSHYIMQRQASLADPNIRAGLVNSPFTSGFMFTGGQHLPDVAPGTMPAQIFARAGLHPGDFMPDLPPLAPAAQLQETLAQQQTGAFRALTPQQRSLYVRQAAGIPIPLGEQFENLGMPMGGGDPGGGAPGAPMGFAGYRLKPSVTPTAHGPQAGFSFVAGKDNEFDPTDPTAVARAKAYMASIKSAGSGYTILPTPRGTFLVQPTAQQLPWALPGGSTATPPTPTAPAPGPAPAPALPAPSAAPSAPPATPAYDPNAIVSRPLAGPSAGYPSPAPPSGGTVSVPRVAVPEPSTFAPLAAHEVAPRVGVVVDPMTGLPIQSLTRKSRTESAIYKAPTQNLRNIRPQVAARAAGIPLADPTAALTMEDAARYGAAEGTIKSAVEQASGAVAAQFGNLPDGARKDLARLSDLKRVVNQIVDQYPAPEDRAQYVGTTRHFLQESKQTLAGLTGGEGNPDYENFLSLVGQLEQRGFHVAGANYTLHEKEIIHASIPTRNDRTPAAFEAKLRNLDLALAAALATHSLLSSLPRGQVTPELFDRMFDAFHAQYGGGAATAGPQLLSIDRVP